MMTLEEYGIYKDQMLKILQDVYLGENSEQMRGDRELVQEKISQGQYAALNGQWERTEKHVYVYDVAKVQNHFDEVCAMCKKIHKIYAPTEKNAGSISPFDLLMDHRICRDLTSEARYEMVLLSNHFTNLLILLNLGRTRPAKYQEHKTYLIVLNPQYREYVNG